MASAPAEKLVERVQQQKTPKNKQAERVSVEALPLPPCFVLLSFLYLLIQICLAEALKPVMACLS